MSSADFLKKIDEIIKKSIDKYSTALFTLVTKQIKKSTKEKNLSTAIVKLKPSDAIFSEGSFTFLDKSILELQKIMNASLKREFGAAITEFEELYNVSIGRAKFYKEIGSLVDATTSQIPNAIFNDVLNAAMLTLTDAGDTAIVADLAAKISNSIRKSRVLLQETLAIANRNFRNETFKRIEKEGDLYLYAGPSDSKNVPPCTGWVGKTKTRKEWESLKADIFTNGGHFGCRHTLVLIPADEKIEDYNNG